jgi:branched-chain amino acid transport system ATP-binding protein
MTQTRLELDGVTAGYGDLTVLDGLSLRVAAGEMVVVSGPNGAGKTTMLSCIAGSVRPRRGSIRLDCDDLLRLPIGKRARRGVGLVPEGRGLFPSLTVWENFRVAARAGTLTRRERDHGVEAAVATFPMIAERVGQRVGSLSGGEQRMVAVARALLANPRVLLLDEPSIGLATIVWERLLGTLRSLADEGRIVVLVEQRTIEALASADRYVVIRHGRLVLDRPADGIDRAELKTDWLTTAEAS